MSKVPLILGLAKKHGPDIIKYSKTLANELPGMINKTNEIKESREKNKQINMHPRKKLLENYQLTFLPELDKKNRSELIHARLEVNQNIKQIKEEQQKEALVKKVLRNSKEIIRWKNLLAQINDKIAIKDLEEYRRLYNHPDHTSDYFDGFQTHIDKYKRLLQEENGEKIIAFLHEQTGISREEIKREFLFD
ncbi:hypothetical protein [Jeotgalibacillus sp. JSM ZJ347]|uniref:hypothetical protein n=1 Tax=Jeotgalibacillus sp. JSM ZJ347 TaxID=3342117 RepID=UPI0035A81C4F